jgi:uncharacterized protein (TIGR02996 family)
MADTLESLNRAVIASPQDRTVRLVYADALDESGDPADAARAEFVRAQIGADGLPEGDPRRVALWSRARDLFDAHWLEWWQPVCEAAGLPQPHVPGRRRRAPLPPGARRTRRPRNWPYTHTAADTTVHATGYGMSVQFAGGFPEEVRFVNMDTPENAATLVHRWGDAMPLARLAFTHPVTPREWKRVNGPHLARLPELAFNQLPDETTRFVASSRHLAALTRLVVHPLGADTGALRALVAAPAWAGLRALQFTGPLSPEGVRELAEWCRLKKLEELELALGNPADPFGAIGAIGAMLGQVIRAFAQAIALPAWNGTRWAEFGPALEALAGAPWVRGLRRLRISSGHHRGLVAMLGGQLRGTAERAADLIPDGAVLALADALNRKKLEKLVVSEVLISPSARAELVTRLRDKVGFE